MPEARKSQAAQRSGRRAWDTHSCESASPTGVSCPRRGTPGATTEQTVSASFLLGFSTGHSGKGGGGGEACRKKVSRAHGTSNDDSVTTHLAPRQPAGLQGGARGPNSGPGVLNSPGQASPARPASWKPQRSLRGSQGTGRGGAPWGRHGPGAELTSRTSCPWRCPRCGHWTVHRWGSLRSSAHTPFRVIKLHCLHSTPFTQPRGSAFASTGCSCSSGGWG